MEAEENQKIKLESPHRHHRQSARLANTNYSLPGFYFITICTKNRECLFGEIVDGEMKLNDYGNIVNETWHELPHYFLNIVIDEFVVMPNHMHGIIEISDCRGGVAPPRKHDGAMPGGRDGKQINHDVFTAGRTVIERNSVCVGGETPPLPTVRLRPTLGQIVGYYKYKSTRIINDKIFESIGNPVWQRNYYEHIIRTNESLHRVRGYIRDNLASWESDQNNPNNIKHGKAKRRTSSRGPQKI